MEHQGTLHPLHPLPPPLRPSPSRPGRHLPAWRCLYKRHATTRKVDLDCQLYHNLQVKCWNPNYQCMAYLPTLIRLMEQILHHLGCPKRSWYWYKTNIWGILSGAGFFPTIPVSWIPHGQYVVVCSFSNWSTFNSHKVEFNKVGPRTTVINELEKNP